MRRIHTFSLYLVGESCTHLDPEHFYLEVVDLLRPIGRSHVLRLCCHANVNSDLEVVLLLADEGFVSYRVDEAFICVYVVGRKRPRKGSWKLNSLCRCRCLV